MRSAASFILIGLVLCACATAAEQLSQSQRGDILIVANGDPNGGVVPPAGADPNRAWVPAAHLTADWESVSVSMTSQIYNPAVRPDAAAPGPQWSMSVGSVVDIIDSNGLIGLAASPKSVKAFDQSGRLVASVVSDSFPVRLYQQPTSWSLPESFPSTMRLNRVALNLPVGPDVEYPEVLSRVEWAMNVLVTDELKTVDVPFKVGESWVELTPGMEILMEQATVQEGKYEYRAKVRYDNTRVGFLMTGSVSLWREQALPPAAVLKIEVLNAQGQPVRSGSGSSSSSASGGGSTGQMTGTMSGRGTCAACGDAAILRFTLAFDLYEQEASFVLSDVPVPEF